MKHFIGNSRERVVERSAVAGTKVLDRRYSVCDRSAGGEDLTLAHVLSLRAVLKATIATRRRAERIDKRLRAPNKLTSTRVDPDVSKGAQLKRRSVVATFVICRRCRFQRQGNFQNAVRHGDRGVVPL